MPWRLMEKGTRSDSGKYERDSLKASIHAKKHLECVEVACSLGVISRCSKRGED